MEAQALPNRTIACIDMRSFYASCAAVERGLDPLEAYIAVVGNQERKGSVVLAASPRMKKEFGVKTGTRLFEIPDDPRILLVEPRMGFFLRVSIAITELLMEFVPKESVHVYSVDESFVDLTHVEALWGKPEAVVRHIQDALIWQFGLPSAVGLGPNMLLAKLALDLEAKKTGFAEWTYEDVPKKLWPVAPLSKMWGIGSRTERTLNGMGIFSIGDLAQAELSVLEDRFGILGHQLYQHAHGIDFSQLGALLLEGQVSYGKGQILYRDYIKEEEIMTIILEMCEDVAMRARVARKAGRTIHLSIGYSKTAFGGGFSRSQSIDEATNETMKIYKVCQELFRKFHQDKPVRQVSLSITNLEDESSMQLSLFEARKWEKRKVGAAMDTIREKYGYSAVYRAVSGTEAGTAIARTRLIGGHIK
ncbi:UV damage repair protein UvrX [Planomicrobium sp. CPCC 101079]|uniref:Y-family DNA polymerase n=1 Tax=Planomicrobium sp. CPCC 101079 TaxID=2599618 RepID=UPI0011B67DCE|nr:UV damage repair protein UvrX [Planomicrobium sp. CPCC 101079]TWT01852.1 UV damage repair protein UvrX [Planomicrobium sp. CPCC 101079]